MDMPKFVKYTCIGDGDGAGIEYGDVLKVLTSSRFDPDFLYVETPIQSKYCGSSAMNKNKLKGKKFTYLSGSEYEIIKEEKKVETKHKHKFKIGDIVCGNGMGRYGYTNSNMTKGKVVDVNPHTGFIDIKVLKHKLYSSDTIFHDLDFRYFDPVESKPLPDTLYHFTTDMKTFVDVEHNGNKGWSKCDTRYDEFDIHIGVDLALERLDEVEHPPMPEPVKELPKYVRYIGGIHGLGGLVEGDICKVLSAGMDEGDLYVSVPKATLYNGKLALNPENLTRNFVLLFSHNYENVTVHD